MKNEMNVEHSDKKLNSAEQAKLWITYMGNTMSICVLSYMLNNIEDQAIKKVMAHALGLAEQFVKFISEIYKQESYPMPKGFTEEDVNISAPRLFTDEFYLHYLKYTGKAGISIYGIAVPLMIRPDIRAFFTQCIDSTIKLMNQVNELLIIKGGMTEPTFIPYPSQIDFIEKQNFLNGFFGNIRPLQALEITHLYENIENNAISKSVLTGFVQVAQLEQVKDYFQKGLKLTAKHYDIFNALLHNENLSTSPILDPFVTTSTHTVFSDKLMMAHKLDMFSMRIRTYGNALAFSARHDVSLKYGRFLVELGNYTEDGANILIDHGRLEKPPSAADRQALAKA